MLYLFNRLISCSSPSSSMYVYSERSTELAACIAVASTISMYFLFSSSGLSTINYSSIGTIV